MHITSRHRAATIDLLRLIPHDGGSRRSLPDGVGPDCHRKVDGFRDVYGRLWWDRPAVAITARCRTPSCGRFAHPSQDRGLSVREAALLQGFPANFDFAGPFDDKYKQIGNAVSPIFARSLAEHIARAWTGKATPTAIAGDVNTPITKSISSALAGMKRSLRLAESLGEDAA
ncbi:MAG: DNA cytosine methyltransferase [Sandaracinaceae bacterium]|nr:DNA cytosine methyltransferase [Sandaracinaceae bacterium]